MKAAPKSRLKNVGTMLSNVVVLGVLLGALYLGHKTHWSFGKTHGSGAAHASTATESGQAGHHGDSAEGTNALAATGLRPVQFDSPEDVQKAGLGFGRAEIREMDEFVTANGIVTYDQDHVAQLSARAAGIVWRVEKKVGDTVRKGDVLAILDSVEVGRAKADFLQSMVHYDLTVKNLARLKSITASVPERMVREAEAGVREDRVRRFNAQQTLINLGLPVDITACEQLSDEELAAHMHFLGLPEAIASSLGPKMTTANLIPLIAPFDGVVISREIVIGEVVDPTRPQFGIADVSRMWIVLNVDREDASLVDIDQELEFHANGMPGEVSSKLVWISTEVDRKTRTVQVRAIVDNPLLDDGPNASQGQRLLRANMFGTGKVRIKYRPKAVAVPGDAVQTSGSRKLVFVPSEDGRSFEPREVRLGVSGDGYTEILEGLSAGDEVITTGSYMLKSELFGMGD